MKRNDDRPPMADGWRRCVETGEVVFDKPHSQKFVRPFMLNARN